MSEQQTQAVSIEPEAKAEQPVIGREYENAHGHVLRVQSVRVGDPLGREVTGTVRERLGENAYSEARDYSTTLVIWEAKWLNKEPPWDPGFAKSKGDVE